MGKTAIKNYEKKIETPVINIEGHSKTRSKVKAYRKKQRRKCVAVNCGLLLFVFIFITFAIWDIRTSRFDAWLLSDISSRFSYGMEPGPSPAIYFPYAGPYDKRLGYSSIQDYTDNLIEKGYNVGSQARFSPTLLSFTKRGVYTIYREKTQAGLQIYDRDGRLISSSLYPQLAYPNLESIPKVIVDTLLFIENRELLDERYPYRNPAVEWDRFSKAILDMAIHKVFKGHKAVGGSTMATQLEKYRHSPEGRTSEGKDKITQMTSAALRTYLNGEQTMEARKQLVVDYINSVPLAACSGFGEVNGLGDGLLTWYGTDFNEMNSLLSNNLNSLPSDQMD
jgi:membrane peptidoglycan carboxypeptidase